MKLFFLSRPDTGKQAAGCALGPARRARSRAASPVPRCARSRRTRKTRTGLAARPPGRPSLADTACGRGLGRLAGARSGGVGRPEPALSPRASVSLPTGRSSACLFSRLKGPVQRWQTSLTSTQKREKGREQSCLLSSKVRRSRRRKKIFEQSVRKHCLSQELCNLSECGLLPLRLISGHQRHSHNFFKLQNEEFTCRLAAAEEHCTPYTT